MQFVRMIWVESNQHKALIKAAESEVHKPECNFRVAEHL